MIDADKPRLIIDAEKMKNRVMMRYAIDKKYDFKNSGNCDLEWILRVIDEMAKEPNEKKVTECNVYNKCEEFKNCTVQVLTNTVTGEVSVGWWQGTADEIRF